MRQWTGLGAVIVFVSSFVPTALRADSAQPAPEKPSAYEFEGRLGYRSWDGALVPVVPDAVLVGSGDGACQFTLQSPGDVRVKPDGTFLLSVALVSSAMARVVVRHPDGSIDQPTCAEMATWPCYRFRAAGCDDRILQFGAEPPNRVVELNCPVRRGPRPKRDG